MSFDQPQTPWAAPPTPRPARSIAALLVLVLVFVVGVAVGSSGVFGRAGASSSEGGGTPAASSQPAGSGGPSASLAPNAPFDVGLFNEALNTIMQNYVGRSDLNSQALTYGAIKGLVDALGDTAHSVFLTPAEAQAEQGALDQNVVGIGVLLGAKDGQTIVASVVPGSPAEAAGLKAGDVLISVDGQSVQGLTPDKVVQQVRGDEGSQVTVTIQRPSTGEQLDFNITRAHIKLPAVSWTMIPGTNIALLRYLEFNAGSADELQAARDQAIAAGATSIIVDLRGNPGGYVGEAVKSASEFLHGATVYIRETADGQKIPVMTDDSVPSTDLPLVLIVDQNTASSSEIFTGAMQAAGRAPVVGETTFGTGTVLLPFTLSDGSVVRLAVERWLTPQGDLIFGKGITPTYPVALGANGVPLEPTDVQNLTPDQLSSISDVQLLEAISLAGGPAFSPPPSASEAPSASP